MKPLIALTIAATKRYIRNYSSWITSLAIPLVMILIFGLFSGTTSKINIGIDNESKNDSSIMLINQLKCSNRICNDKSETNTSPFKITLNDKNTLENDLSKGDLAAVLIIPSDFDGNNKENILLLKNQSKAQESSTAQLIISNIIDNTYNIKPIDKKIGVDVQQVDTKNLSLIDSLIPGILGISIMNLGIFAVAFAFVSQKTTGVLRRLLVAPISGAQIIISEGFSKLVICIIQVILFLYIGVQFFNLKILGSLPLILLVTALGSIVFLAIGFGIAGYARDENQASPFAQLINLPLTFLSGAFFPRDIFPQWLKTITDFLPLTYLNDALRRVINDGANIWDIKGQILGLFIWGIIVLFISFKIFRWK